MNGRKTAAVAVAVALATVSAGCSAEPDRPSAPQAAPPGLEAFYGQEPSWRDCGGGFNCSTIEVPLDYAKPAGGRLKIAMIRLPATDKDKRIGSLVLNPGGPGGSGVEYARSATNVVSKEVRERFDVVGFDPRGVGKSNPVRCLAPQGLDEFFGTDTSPDDETEEGVLNTVSKKFADGCTERARTLLPRVGTKDAARDMDVMRAVLGDDGLTYLGKSYGTYLGAFYAEQFPKRVRALVLDGAVDPKLSALDLNREQGKGFETALRAFVADCVKRSDCPLGTTDVNAGLNRISALLDQADRTPLGNSLNDGREADEALVTLGIAASLYSKESWTYLRLALRQAMSGDGAVLLKLGDLLVERRDNGEYSNQTEANMAVNCIDKPFPREPEAYAKEAEKARREAPRFGGFVMWGSLPCAHWPSRTSAEPRAVKAAGAKPIMVVGTTRDPATPYKWSQSLAGQLESGVLLTMEGDGHTAYFTGNRCVDDAVDRYFIDAKPSREGLVCR